MGKKPQKSLLSKALRPILAANLKSRMGSGKDRKPLRGVGGISASQLGRIIRQESAATVDALSEMASGLGCQPWELLIPNENRASEKRIQYNKNDMTMTAASAPSARRSARTAPAFSKEATAVAELIDRQPPSARAGIVLGIQMLLGERAKK
jgi:hypothetical protein